MTYFFMYDVLVYVMKYITYILTPWRTFRHQIYFLASWHTFVVNTNFWRPRVLFQVITYFWRHGVTLTSWRTFNVIVYVVCCHDVPLTLWQTLRPWHTWRHDVIFDIILVDITTYCLTSWCTFDVMMYFWHIGVRFDVMIYFSVMAATFWHNNVLLYVMIIFWRTVFWRHGVLFLS